jgi:two-component system CheB/CheR fusion protein
MTANVSEMGREGIKNELASAVRKAINTDTDVTYEHLQLKKDGGFGLVNLIIKRLTPPQESRKLYLIIFQDVVTIEKEALDVTKRQTKRAVDDRIAELDRELKSTRENLQTTVEELETSNEELKSANEELQSTNEELQSTNEELETSREELQSVNEELLTVNAEHQTKIEELSKSNDDIKNFLDVTMVAIILLDSNLCIRRYTVETTKIFNIISSDIGRPIRHITSRIKYDNLVQDAEQVLDTLTPKVMEVQTEEGHWYNMNILPYRTTENVISGIVITFMDIGNIKKAAEEATARELAEKKVDEEKAARELAEAIVDTVREPLMVLNGDLRVISANQSFYDVFKVSVKETIGQFVYDLGNKQWDIQRLRHLLEDVLPRDSSFKDFEVEYDFLNIGHRKMLLNARKVQQHLGKKGLILLAIEDITDKK